MPTAELLNSIPQTTTNHRNPSVLTFCLSHCILLWACFRKRAGGSNISSFHCVCSPWTPTPALFYPPSNQSSPISLIHAGCPPLFSMFWLDQKQPSAPLRLSTLSSRLSPPCPPLPPPPLLHLPLLALLSPLLLSPFFFPLVSLPFPFPLPLWLLIGCLSACGSCVLCVIEQRG